MNFSSIPELFKRYYLVFLFGLLAFTFATRFWRLDTPKEYIFDEVYHALTGKLMARGDERAFEWWHEPVEPNTAIEWTHPPLGKVFHAMGILAFGENSFGWRISSVIFGVGVIYLIVRITDFLFEDKALSLLSGFLFSLEGLHVTQSRIAMNDIHLTFFILLTFLFYIIFKKEYKNNGKWQKYLLYSGIGFGLTFATKWSGILILGVMIIDQIFEALRSKKISFQLYIMILFSWVIVPTIVYTLSYSQMFLQGKDLVHFKELNQQMWWYHSGLVATHPYQSTPLEWIFNLRPVWIYVDYSNPTKISNIYAQSNTILAWGGLAAVVGLILKSVLHRNMLTVKEKGSQLLLSIQLNSYNDNVRLLLMAYVIFWVPYLLSPRIMFFYHYLPAFPFLTILLAYTLQKLWEKNDAGKYVGIIVVLLAVTNFMIFYANWTGLPVTKEFQETWYHLIPTWQ